MIQVSVSSEDLQSDDSQSEDSQPKNSSSDIQSENTTDGTTSTNSTSSDDRRVSSSEENIFANTKIVPFYSSDASSDYNFQYPYAKNRFDI